MSSSNWAGNIAWSSTRFEQPRGVEELSTAVAANARIKAVGAGHSFTSIADTDGLHLSLGRMNRLLSHDPTHHRVTVEAGMSLHELNIELERLGHALPNLGDVDPQSVAGAINTGTHGTGGRKRGIAAAVSALQLVTGTGEVVEIDETHPWFEAARVGLGALGIVSAVTLQCVPAFALQAREEPMALPEILEQLDELVDTNDHFEFFWFPHTQKALVKRNNTAPLDRLEPLPTWRYRLDDEFLSNTVFEAAQRLGKRWPSSIRRINALSGSALGTREYSDLSHKVFVSPRRVRFRESEFAMPRTAARDVIAELQSWYEFSGEHISFPVEVRFTASDSIWMSTGYERDNVYVAVHQYHRTDEASYFAAAQSIFTAHAGRPHWGKMHSLDAAYFRDVYPRFDDFRAVRDNADPERRFTNAYLDRVLG